MQRKIDTEEVESKCLKGGSMYKCARVHNNFKSEDLLLKRKVVTYLPCIFIPCDSATLSYLATLPYGQKPNRASAMWVSIWYL